MDSVIEELKREVERLALKNGLNDKSLKILLWFADESLGIDGRISESKLKQQVSRLGATNVGDEE